MVADVGNTTTYTDTGLTNGNEYCYKVTAYYSCDSQTVESAYSNIRCATPQAPGQNTLADVSEVVTGIYDTTGKGKNQTTTFSLSDTFTTGGGVVIRTTVLDEAGQPVSNASVDIAITGPETVSLTTGPSDSSGLAEVTWNTTAPNRKGSRTRPMPVEAIPEGMREVVSVTPVGEVVEYDGPNVSYLIKVLEKIDGKKRSFEEAKEDVQKHLRELREQRLLNDWYETQIEAATIEHLTGEGQDGT